MSHIVKTIRQLFSEARDVSKTIHLDLPKRVVDRLDAVRRLNGASSDIETIQRALALYDTLLTIKQTDGGEIHIHTNDGRYKKLEIT